MLGILTFSDTVDESVPLIDAHEAVFKARHLLGDILIYFLVARVHRATAFLERIGALV